MNSPFQNALAQLEKAAKLQQFSESFLIQMRSPQREIKVAIPVQMDNGTTQVFEGYRVQYNNARGPYKGGIRYHQHTDIEEVKALAFWMALKTAVANIPMGGGKGGITVDPRTLSNNELEKLSRGWVKAFAPVLGPHQDVPAPDVNTTPQIMSWMVDEYEKLTDDKTKATFTGKPLNNGGSEGRNLATGMGGFYVFEALRAAAGLPEKVTVAIQGMGNVGGNAGHIFRNHGHTVIAISDSKGGIYNQAGLDMQAVEQYKHTHGSLRDFPGAKMISNQELLELQTDVLIPAALENQITEANAQAIKAHLVLELANGPTTPEADEILFKNGIHVVPDILANAGGVIVSTFEWEQNLKNQHWSEDEVNQKLQKILAKEAHNIWTKATNLKTDLRRAAFVVALERLEQAMTA